MKFLFIATLGPVQPFIASARRTRDLYVGSTLLSELSKAAAAEIDSKEGRASLVFPAPRPLDKDALVKDDLQPGSALNVANKIVAVIQQDPRRLGEAVRDAIKERLEKVRKDAFDGVKLIDEEKAKQQIDNLIEYAWVAVPFERDDGDYKRARKEAEEVLEARKNTHFFREVTWGDHVAKSSIDGQRESVINSDLYAKYKDSQEEKKAKAKALYDMYKAGPHEQLSAVDLLKRLAWSKQEQMSQETPLPLILSTSHIAATPFLQQLDILKADEQKEAKKLWKAYIRNVRKLVPSKQQDSENGSTFSSILEYIPRKSKLQNKVTDYYDGALLFKERLLEDVVSPKELMQELKDAYKALDEFFKFTDKHLNGMRPSPYYAILLADGDGMGDAIEARDNKEAHQKLSQTLARFAGEVRGIVNDKYHGSLVYAGGDDVMALLPLYTILDCAQELSKTFKEMLGAISDGEKSPTLSVGIAVVHHLALLLDSLELARDAERKAKAYVGGQDHPDKNALAIIVKKRGGEQNEMVVSWEHYEGRLDLLVELYKANILPHGMAYELRTIMERLQTSRQDERDADLQKIVQLEAARILRRKVYFSGRRQAREQDVQIEQVLSRHLPPDAISEEAMKQLKTPQDKARYLLLQQIGMRERNDSGFEILETQNIASFINALIVAQAFIETFKPEQVKGEIV